MQTTSLQAFALFLTVLFPVLASIAATLRVYSRKRVGQFGLDDICIIIATTMSIAETYFSWMFIIKNYTGWHQDDIPPEDFDYEEAQKYNFAVQVLYNPILSIVKISVLLFLHKLGGHKQNIRYSIWALGILTVALMIAVFFADLFQCLPIAANWWTPAQMEANGGHCIDQAAFYVSTAVATIITDLFVLAIPFWIVLGLKMPARTKIAVLAIFFMGFIVTMVGVGRLIILVRAFYGTALGLPPNTDRTRSIGFITSTVEYNLAIIAACAPALKPLFRMWFPRLFSSTAKSGYPSGPYMRSSNRRHTIMPGLKGGHGGYVMRDMSKDGRTEIRSDVRAESDEEIMTFDGIMKTTDVNVRYTDGYSGASVAGNSWDGKEGVSVKSAV